MGNKNPPTHRFCSFGEDSWRSVERGYSAKGRRFRAAARLSGSCRMKVTMKRESLGFVNGSFVPLVGIEVCWAGKRSRRGDPATPGLKVSAYVGERICRQCQGGRCEGGGVDQGPSAGCCQWQCRSSQVNGQALSRRTAGVSDSGNVWISSQNRASEIVLGRRLRRGKEKGCAKVGSIASRQEARERQRGC